MPRVRVPAHFFVFVVVEHAGSFLVIREAKHGQLWYAPAGGLEPGESIRDAAVRETFEEAGVLVEPTGLLRVEQNWYGELAWWRFVVSARPVGATSPKRVADQHSLEARWMRPEAIRALPLRHPEVLDLFALTDAVPLVA